MKKNKVTFSAEELTKLVGKDKADEIISKKHEIRLKRKMIRRVEIELSKHSMCTLRVTKAGGRVEVVNHKFVVLIPRFNFEKGKGGADGKRNSEARALQS